MKFSTTVAAVTTTAIAAAATTVGVAIRVAVGRWWHDPLAMLAAAVAAAIAWTASCAVAGQTQRSFAKVGAAAAATPTGGQLFGTQRGRVGFPCDVEQFRLR